MAQPTDISAVTDNVEYSRYESAKNTINVTVSVTGGAPYTNETIVVELVKARRSRDAVVATANLSITGAADPQIASASFKLPDIVDQDLINLVRHGNYYIRARSPATGSSIVIGAPSAAPITLTTVDTGTDTNAWTVVVNTPGGSSPLSVVIVGTAVTIDLAVASGVPIPAQNTREAIVAQILANYGNQLYASFTGAPGLSLSVPEALASFVGGRDEVVGSSSDFAVRIVTVERLKNDFLFGIPLYAGDYRFVKYQPTNITGVVVTEVSRTHPMGLFPLTYTYHVDVLTNATATIGSGANGTVSITADNALAGAVGNTWNVQVFVPSGTSPLTVNTVGTTLQVLLDVTLGVPNAAANTATLIAAAISALPNFSAAASGTGVTPLSVAEGPNAFSGGTENVIRQLSWNGGPLVSVNSPGTYILRRGGSGSGAGCSPKLLTSALGQDYIVVRVAGPTFLPTTNSVDELIVQNRQLDDEALGKYLCAAEDWLENVALAIYVEPTNVVTDRDPTTIQYAAGINAPNPIFTDPDYDFLVGPLTYFVPRSGEEWIGIQTPFPQIIRVDSLFGSIANTRVIDIDLDWIQNYTQGGLLQLVPFNQTIAFDFIGLIWVNAIRGAAAIPNFWHFNMIVGLRDCSCDLQELIAKKAAMDALIMLGTAIRPGIGSVSLGRDGVSQSVSYNTQQQYGAYTGAITAFKEWIENNLNKYKGKYRGATMVVV
jgi:hypothetical protein